MTEWERLKKRLGIIAINVPGETLEKFRERTSGLIEARWAGTTNPDGVSKAVELYGFDCYLQGMLDAVEVCKIMPELTLDRRDEHE